MGFGTLVAEADRISSVKMNLKLEVVDTVNITALAVTTEKIADSAITVGKITDSSISTTKVVDLAITTGKIANLGVTTDKIANAAITYGKIKTKGLVALGDAATTLTGTQMVDSAILTITPTVARILTTATGTAIITALAGAPIGTWFSMTIVNTAAFDVTLAPGVDVTMGAGQGKHVINNVSGTWIGLVTGTTTVTIYRA